MRVRKHVLSDLQPYVCTYPDCQLNDHFFEKKDDWYQHESRVHRVQWFCNTETHDPFIDIEDFLDHMHKIHSEPLDKAQLLSFRRGFQRPSGAHSGTCTLCNKETSRLKSHIARHLEQLALFAIPPKDYRDDWKGDDSSSDNASSNATRRDLQTLSSSHKQKESSEGRSEGSAPKFDDWQDDRMDESNPQGTEIYDGTALGSFDQLGDEWNFIPPKFEEPRVRDDIPSTRFPQERNDSEVTRGRRMDEKRPRIRSVAPHPRPHSPPQPSTLTKGNSLRKNYLPKNLLPKNLLPKRDQRK